jgi:hypothetical protein
MWAAALVQLGRIRLHPFELLFVGFKCGRQRLSNSGAYDCTRFPQKLERQANAKVPSPVAETLLDL